MAMCLTATSGKYNNCEGQGLLCWPVSVARRNVNDPQDKVCRGPNAQAALCSNPGAKCTGSVSKLLLGKGKIISFSQAILLVAILSEIGKS